MSRGASDPLSGCMQNIYVTRIWRKKWHFHYERVRAHFICVLSALNKIYQISKCFIKINCMDYVRRACLRYVNTQHKTLVHLFKRRAHISCCCLCAAAAAAAAVHST